MQQEDAAGDEGDAGELGETQRLAPQEVADHGDKDIARRDAGKGERQRDLLDGDDVEDRGDAVDGEAEDGEGVEELRYHAGRALGAGLEQDLAGDAEENAGQQRGIIGKERGHQPCRMTSVPSRSSGWRSSGSAAPLRVTSLTVDCGLPLAVR